MSANNAVSPGTPAAGANWCQDWCCYITVFYEGVLGFVMLAAQCCSLKPAPAGVRGRGGGAAAAESLPVQGALCPQ
jgi:hypothetical protein